MEALKSVYKSVEDIDYMVGCLAEQPRPQGYIISDTAFYVFIMNASRRLLCDRFYQARAHLTSQVALLSSVSGVQRAKLDWCESRASHGTGSAFGSSVRRSVRQLHPSMDLSSVTSGKTYKYLCDVT